MSTPDSKTIQRRIALLDRRGEGHWAFALHAAFPLSLTPRLAYLLWANFQTYASQGAQQRIPWVAVSDLLLSPVCREIQPELYELDPAIRRELLIKLETDKRFGKKRIEELSRFLLNYVKKELTGEDQHTKHQAQLQSWMALAYVQPNQLARELAERFRTLQAEERMGAIRLAAITETFAEPLKEFRPLIGYAKYRSAFARGDRLGVRRTLKEYNLKRNQLVEGIPLFTFDSFDQEAKDTPGAFIIPEGTDRFFGRNEHLEELDRHLTPNDLRQESGMPDRKNLIKNLLALSLAQFELIVAMLDEKQAFQSGNGAEHSIRVVRFVEWAEAPGGCTLEAIEEELRDQGLLRVEPTSKPAGFSTVRRETERFFGRTDKLEELKQFFQFDGKLKIAAAYGLPGVGKTQFALRYANDHHAAYQFTFFIVAATIDSLNEGFSELANQLQLPIIKTEKPSQRDINRSVVDWLENNDGWLAIYDNADDAAILELIFREYLPKHGAGHVLLTTREATARLVPCAIPLDIFSEDDGAKFILEKTGQKDETSARQLTQAVGGLPLALDQAVAYIVGTDCSIKSYLGNYRKEGKRLRETYNRIASDHDSVATTISLAFKPIAEKHPATADILRICAFCAPDNIPEELFRNAGNELGDTIANVIENDLDWDNALKEATRFSLLKRNPETSMLTIHRVVQDVIKDEMSGDEQDGYAMRLVGAIQAGIGRVNSKNLEAGARLTPQVREAAVLVGRFQQVTVLQINQIARFLQDNIQYASAQPLFELALNLEAQESGLDHPKTATAHSWLAASYESQGRYAEAEPLYERALGIRERTLGSEHPDTAQSLNNLALLYRSQGRYAEAEPLYERALGIRERALGLEHPDTAQSLNNLALLFASLGRYAEAEPLYERALGIYERTLGGEHRLTATSLNNLAGLYQSQGRYAEAEPLYERALGIYERTLGGEHPDTALLLNNLGILYASQGRYAEAELLYERALGIYRRALGEEHPYTAQLLNNMAKLFESKKQFTEAESLLEKALSIYQKFLGDSHPDTLSVIQSLNRLREETQNNQQREPNSPKTSLNPT